MQITSPNLQPSKPVILKDPQSPGPQQQQKLYVKDSYCMWALNLNSVLKALQKASCYLLLYPITHVLPLCMQSFAYGFHLDFWWKYREGKQSIKGSKKKSISSRCAPIVHIHGTWILKGERVVKRTDSKQKICTMESLGWGGPKTQLGYNHCETKHNLVLSYKKLWSLHLGLYNSGERQSGKDRIQYISHVHLVVWGNCLLIQLRFQPSMVSQTEPRK